MFKLVQSRGRTRLAMSREEFHQAVSWGLNQLVHPNLKRRLWIHLVHRKPRDCRAMCEALLEKNGHHRTFRMYILPKRGKYRRSIYRKKALDFVFHELVHVMQYATKKLDEDPQKWVRYAGKTYRGREVPSYYHQPWEIEARRTAEKLVARYYKIFG